MRLALAFLLATCGLWAAPDIRSVKPDLVVPPLSDDAPAAGRRIKQVHPDWAETQVYHLLYLPHNWKPEVKLPVIVEFAGNGPYRSPFGDVSTGRPEGSTMGYGISGGQGFLWICLPYLNNTSTANVTRWWGNAPKYDAGPTVAYTKEVVPWICKKYGGDSQRVILCGFSRGAIACNFIGLHDDDISKLWWAMIPYSHYDGVIERWGYPGADRKSALARLKRLGLSLAEIKELSGIYAIAGSTQAMLERLQELLKHQLQDVDGRLGELTVLREELDRYQERISSRIAGAIQS